MRSQRRGQIKIHYQNLLRDKQGNLYYEEDSEGNRVPSYGDIKECLVGEVTDYGYNNTFPFGKNPDYDKSIVTHQKYHFFGEYARVWLYNDYLTQPHDYEVLRSSNTLNANLVVLKKVVKGNVQNNNDYVR